MRNTIGHQRDELSTVSKLRDVSSTLRGRLGIGWVVRQHCCLSLMIGTDDKYNGSVVTKEMSTVSKLYDVAPTLHGRLVIGWVVREHAISLLGNVICEDEKYKWSSKRRAMSSQQCVGGRRNWVALLCLS